MKQINVKLLAILGISAVVLLGGVKWLHDVQAVRGAGGMLTRAEEAKAEGDYEQAVKLLSRYLSRRPDEDEQYANLALTMKKYIESSRGNGRQIDPKLFHRTYATIEKALRKSPNDVVLRQAGVDFAMQFGRWTDAVSHIDFLMKADARTPELAVQLATCQLRSGNEDKAFDVLAEMIGFNQVEQSFEDDKAWAPNFTTAYTYLASLFAERKQRIEVARLIVDRLVIVNPDDPKAFVDRASFLRTSESETDKAQAKTDISKAMEMDPEDESAMLLAAQFALDSKDFSLAKQLYDRVLAIKPTSNRALIGLSLWGGATRDIDAAINYLGRAAELQPNNSAIILQQANMELDRGNFEFVEEAIQRLKQLNYSRAFRDFLHGRMHLARGEWSTLR